MLTTISEMSLKQKLLLGASLVFLLVLALGGGASRADVQSQPLVRLAAIAVLAVAVFAAGERRAPELRPLFILYGGYALLVALQLVPLPPGLWTALPGREFYAGAAAVVGMDQPARPISLAPDLTINSLLAILPPLAVAAALAAGGRRFALLFLSAFAIMLAVSALFGMMQMAGGEESALYTYRIASHGSPVGLFANRNHQAVFLALGIPAVMLWAGSGSQPGWAGAARVAGAALVIGMLLLAVLLTGSRSGLLTAALAVLGGLALLGVRRLKGLGLLGLGGVAAGALVVGGLLFAGGSRLQIFDRLESGTVEEEQRLQLLPDFVEMARTFFPVGSGFGSFSPVYQRFERDEFLDPTYLNQAHNELAQVLIEGGAAGLLLLLGFLVWWGRLFVAAWRPRPSGAGGADLARLGSIATLLMLIASLTDYPLRTPLLASLFTLALVCMASIGLSDSARRRRN